MKELEKTKRISISAVIFLLIVVIALLTYKKPEFSFDKNTKATLEEMISGDRFFTYNDFRQMDPSDLQLIDIRSGYDFNRGHLEGAENISENEILSSGSLDLLRSYLDKGKTIVLYGKKPNEVPGVWSTLFQLGINSKILTIETSFEENTLIVKNEETEKPLYDYGRTMDSLKAKKIIVEGIPEKVEPKKVAPVQVAPKPKKKKAVPEGGC